MEKMIFAVHSMVDVITNSSTELFIVDADQETSAVALIIEEMEKQFPTDYHAKVFVRQTEEYELNDMFGYIDEDEAVKYLKALGYKVEKPDDNFKLRFITISCERGCMHPDLRKFIETTFNVLSHDTNS